MKTQLHNEQGQSAVIIALALVAILAFAGLVFDVSNAYSQRRLMQNGADAGALAGARFIGTHTGTAADGAALMTEINKYARQYSASTSVYVNYVDSSGNKLNGNIADGWSSSAKGVSVTTEIAFPTFFLGVVSTRQGDVQGHAKAISGQAGPPAGLAPLGEPQCYVDVNTSDSQCGSNPTTSEHVIQGQASQPNWNGIEDSQGWRQTLNFKERYTGVDSDANATGSNQATCSGDVPNGDKQAAQSFIDEGGYAGECGTIQRNQWIDIVTGNGSGVVGANEYQSTGLYPVGSHITLCIYDETPDADGNPVGFVKHGNGTHAYMNCEYFAVFTITRYSSNSIYGVWAGITYDDTYVDNSAPPAEKRLAVQTLSWP